MTRADKPLSALTMTFEISARGRSCFPWSVNFLDFFLAARSKGFWKASLSLMREQVSRLGKSAVVQYVTVFHLILTKRVNTDLGLKAERNHIACFDVGGDESLASKSSLWESNLFGKSKSEADF